LTDIGAVNFNQYGLRDGVGFIPVSHYFIDTVMIRKRAATTEDCNDEKEFVSVATNLLNIKADAFGLSNRTFYCCASSEKNTAIWKYACPNENPQKILSFLEILKSTGFEVYEIDITRDYAGSFDLDEVINHFTDFHNLQVNYSQDNLFMNADMKQCSGNTCFICKDPISGNRQKIYLKFPQMLQSRKVRDDLGNRWFDWTRNVEEEFVTSRNASSIRGMSRVEISVPCSGETIPSMTYLTTQLDHFINLIPSNLSWCTSHIAMWNTFADAFKHTLIVVDESYKKSNADNITGLAIIVYGYNGITKDLVGFTVENWATRGPQVMARFTLSSTLPVDVITVAPISRRLGGEWLEISGARYRKEMKKGQEDLTFFTDKSGHFKFVSTMSVDNLEKCGFIPHTNIHPHIANKKFQVNSRVPATFNLDDELEIKLPDPTTFMRKDAYNKVSPIYNQSDSSAPSSPASIQSLAEGCISNNPVHQSIPVSFAHLVTFEQCDIIKLRKLNRGYYDILSIFTARSHNDYPRLLINNGGTVCGVYCNESLRSQLNSINLPTQSPTMSQEKVGTLIVYCHKRKSSGVYVSDAKIVLA